MVLIYFNFSLGALPLSPTWTLQRACGPLDPQHYGSARQIGSGKGQQFFSFLTGNHVHWTLNWREWQELFLFLEI